MLHRELPAVEAIKVKSLGIVWVDREQGLEMSSVGLGTGVAVGNGVGVAVAAGC